MKKENYKKYLLAFLLIFSIHNLFAADEISWPGGRFALTSDGNMHDVDDTGAIPMSVALMYFTGHKDKIVHLDHSNHFGGSVTEKYADMKASFAGIISHFGINESIIFDCQTQFEAAKANFVKEALKSTANDQLWLICAGPMATTHLYLEAVAKADPTKLPFIHCISHSNANNIHADTDELKGKTWASLKSIYTCVSFHDIANQNKDDGFCSPIANWAWMNETSAPATWKWLYSRNRTATVNVGKFDMSDGGMVYWLLSGRGNVKGNWDNIKLVFKDSIATGKGNVGCEAIPYKPFVAPIIPNN